MGEFSLTHILIVAVLFIIFFGPSRLPGLGQSLGKSIREFKKSLNEIDAEVISEEVKNNPTKPPTQISQKNEQTLDQQTMNSDSFEHKEKKS